MTEKNKWDFRKDGKPFDELPSVIKTNPGFLYEYIRTGEMPNIELLEELVKRDIKIAKNMLKTIKKELSTYDIYIEKYQNEMAVYDEFFIESGYIYKLFTFEELYYETKYFYDDDIPCLKKIKHQLKGFERITNKKAPPEYDMILWSKAIKHAAENKLKELGVEDLNRFNF